MAGASAIPSFKVCRVEFHGTTIGSDALLWIAHEGQSAAAHGSAGCVAGSHAPEFPAQVAVGGEHDALALRGRVGGPPSHLPS